MIRYCMCMAASAALSLGLAAPAGAQEEATTRRVSSAFRTGHDANGASHACDVSEGGASTVFESVASNLVPDDTNRLQDVFLVTAGHRRAERVSITTREKQSKNLTTEADVSADGRYVAFVAKGYELAMQARPTRTVFVRDTKTGRTSRASVRSDGRRVRKGSFDPSLSGNGRYVAFTSAAGDLTTKADGNGQIDVFVHDSKTGKTSRVSLSRDLGDANGQSLEPSISRTGRHVAFSSLATNIVRGDTNSSRDVFVYDVETRQTARVSIASDGLQSPAGGSTPVISGDGRYVAFTTDASLAAADVNDAIDVYVHDRRTGATELVSGADLGPGNGHSLSSSISDDGRYVAFTSTSSNLVEGDTNGEHDVGNGSDLFVRDRADGVTIRVSVGEDSQEGTHDVLDGAMSDDGRFVCWTTASPNLVEGDGNDTSDVFLRGPLW